MINMVYALRKVYRARTGNLSFQEILSASLNLFSKLVTVPSDRMMVGMLNAVCHMWVGLAVVDENTHNILNATTACLKKKTSLTNDLVTSLRYLNCQ